MLWFWLNENAKKIIRSRQNRIYLSAASSWEIAIKVSIGKLSLPLSPKEYIPSRLAKQFKKYDALVMDSAL